MLRGNHRGFTIVELLIVIVVIGILAAIVIVAFNGVQNRAKNSRVQSALTSVHKKIEAYKALNDVYPATQSVALASAVSTGAMVYVDSGCHLVTGTGMERRSDWVPGIDMSLPVSNGETGASSQRGCYMYQSDGTNYVLSAWNMVLGDAQTSTLYRRVGFRETSMAQQFYICNHTTIGGMSAAYTIANDRYKRSYTYSNISSCNETPPAGA